MTETLQIADQTLDLIRKDIKNVHLTVHPPNGRLRISAPLHMRTKTIQTFAITKLPWIRKQQKKLKGQEREAAREFLERESHYLWGQRYLLRLEEHDAAPRIDVGMKILTFFARPGLNLEGKKKFFNSWYREQLREEAQPLISKWEAIIGLKVNRLFIQRMKTKWGSCNHGAGTIRLNSELAKKPRELLEYVVVHEVAHLIEPTHNSNFQATLDHFLPDWKSRRARLNELPV